MARSGIQYGDVQRAIDTLLKRQENPSVQRIREVLGTGSFTTINEHLREWRTRREENRDMPAASGVPEPLEKWTQELWDKAQELAVEHLAHYREQADRRVSEAQEQARQAWREAEDAIQRLEALNTHLGQIQARLEEKTALSARLESERQAAEQREAALSQQLLESERRHQEQQAHQERKIQAYREQLDQMQQEAATRLEQEEQRHEAAEARLMALLDESRQTRQALEKQHAKRVESLENRIEKRERELSEQRRLQEEARETARRSDWEKQRLEEALQASRELAEQARHDKSRLEQEHQQLWAAHQGLQQRLAQTPLPPFVY
ncbi:hypothetical protein GCM10027040_28240 [Halomonas shantousis]